MLNNDHPYCRLCDKKLFELVQKDDKKAFDQIYCRYFNFLTNSAAKHLQSRQKAEDVVQEIFISFYNRRNSIEFSVSLRAYLCQALKFKIMNEYRSQNIRNTYQKAVHYSSAQGNRTDYYQVYETKELAHNINRSINLLPEKCREAFLLSRAEELSYKDISGHLGISVSTVEKHIIKALKFLKGNLNLQ
jgi:RNA polymerase sigma-70 factor (family 1)